MQDQEANALNKVFITIFSIIAALPEVPRGWSQDLADDIHEWHKTRFMDFEGVMSVESNESRKVMTVGVAHRHQLSNVPDHYLGYKVKTKVVGAKKQ